MHLEPFEQISAHLAVHSLRMCRYRPAFLAHAVSLSYSSLDLQCFLYKIHFSHLIIVRVVERLDVEEHCVSVVLPRFSALPLGVYIICLKTVE